MILYHSMPSQHTRVIMFWLASVDKIRYLHPFIVGVGSRWTVLRVG